MAKFRKKPVVIEANQWTGDNMTEMSRFIGKDITRRPGDPDTSLVIETLEGAMKAMPGDWVIKGVKGEFYPCKPDIFEATYEPVIEGS